MEAPPEMVGRNEDGSWVFVIGDGVKGSFVDGVWTTRMPSVPEMAADFTLVTDPKEVANWLRKARAASKSEPAPDKMSKTKVGKPPKTQPSAQQDPQDEQLKQKLYDLYGEELVESILKAYPNADLKDLEKQLAAYS